MHPDADEEEEEDCSEPPWTRFNASGETVVRQEMFGCELRSLGHLLGRRPSNEHCVEH
jgi:hypothetical protein